LQQVDVVGTSPLELEAVRFYVELRILDTGASREAWSGFVDVSSLRCLSRRAGLARDRGGERRGGLCCIWLLGLTVHPS
jgi:hypothetical protein